LVVRVLVGGQGISRVTGVTYVTGDGITDVAGGGQGISRHCAVLPVRWDCSGTIDVTFVTYATNATCVTYVTGLLGHD
jgi:hypothetical protein